jgi:tetratricopeptide (TPR) repeat protein
VLQKQPREVCALAKLLSGAIFAFFYYIALKHDFALLSKSILNKIILWTLFLIASSGRSAAHSTYEFQTIFFEMDTAQRDSVIHSLTIRHFKHPGDQVFIRQLAQAYTAGGQVDSALSYWTLLSTLEPRDDTAAYTQAQLYYDRDSLHSAMGACSQALALQPGRISYMLLMALLDYRLQHPDSAFALCSSILQQSPSDPNALMLSGIIMRDRKNDQEALVFFNKCLKADPANTIALLHRADEYVLLKKYNDALRDYSAARADLSADADVLNNIGICHYQLGAYQQAITFFKKAILINHRHPQSYFNKGLSYYRLKELDTATLDMKTAGAIWDSCHSDTCRSCFLDAIYYLGMCYRQIGDLPVARSHFELLQKEKYRIDLSSEIHYIDCALFISRNWYYFLLLLLSTIGLCIVVYRFLRR